MKKLIFTLVLFWGLQTFAQKTVYIYNFSSYNIEIGEITTKPNTGTYPSYTSVYEATSTSGPSLLQVPSGTTYIIENPVVSRFPFYSPTSVPAIKKWRRYTSASTSGIITSLNLNNSLANTQNFKNIKFQVLAANESVIGGATLSDSMDLYENSFIIAFYEFDSSTGTTSITIIDL